MTDFQTRSDALVSFDGGHRERAEIARPDKLRFWTEREWAAMPPAISRGAGLSYAAASFGAGAVSIEHRAYDRLIAFDAARGALTVEAGASLWTVQRFLLARRCYLPCHPGHGRITIGGCVAVDAHGKNPWRDGTFQDQVLGLTLLHPDHGIMKLDRDGTSDLLTLTCGGFGLTGHILTVTLQAQPLPGPRVMLARHTHGDLDSALAHLTAAVQDADFAYSWHDLSSRAGPHFVFAATADRDSSEAANATIDDAPPLSAAGMRRLPLNLVNRASLPLLNAAYRVKTRRFRDPQPISVLDALFPIHGSEIYFALFGRSGFHEYQALVPTAGAAAFVREVSARAAKRGVAVALCSAKAFGGTAGHIRFAGEGTAIAFDFPRSAATAKLMADIDAMLVEVGGVPNIAKDSRLPHAVARACYAGFDTFRDALLRFDPQRRIRSELSERLRL